MSALRETITEIADATRGRAGTSELIPTMGIAEKIRGLAGPGEVISGGQRYEVESVDDLEDSVLWQWEDTSGSKPIRNISANSEGMIYAHNGSNVVRVSKGRVYGANNDPAWLFIDEDDYMYFVKKYRVNKYDKDLNEVWEVGTNAESKGVTTDADGNVYFCDYAYITNLHKYTAAGEKIFTRALNTTTWPSCVGVYEDKLYIDEGNSLCVYTLDGERMGWAGVTIPDGAVRPKIKGGYIYGNGNLFGSVAKFSTQINEVIWTAKLGALLGNDSTYLTKSIDVGDDGTIFATTSGRYGKLSASGEILFTFKSDGRSVDCAVAVGNDLHIAKTLITDSGYYICAVIGEKIIESGTYATLKKSGGDLIE